MTKGIPTETSEQMGVSNLPEELVERVAWRLERCFTSMPDRLAACQVMLDECAKGTLHDFSRELAVAALSTIPAQDALVGELVEALTSSRDTLASLNAAFKRDFGRASEEVALQVAMIDALLAKLPAPPVVVEDR